MKKTAFLALALAAALCGGCASWFGEKAQEQVAAQARKLVGTDEIVAKFDAQEERQQLAYAFTWLTAEKAGITETQARDFLAGRKGGEGQDAQDEADAAAVDAVEFSRLQWKFGGVDGGKARLDSPRLSGLKAGATGISFKWDTGLEGWGLSREDAGALACFFVEKEDGSVVGGKFDWVSTSRSTRGLENVFDGYAGWTLEGVPNPCKCWFVVTSRDGKKRSNVVGAEWQR